MKWKKFLKGFLWKIEAGEKKLKGFPFNSPLGQSCTCCILQWISFITPALVLHVLHLKGISFITMGVGGIKGNFIYMLSLIPVIRTEKRSIRDFYRGFSYKITCVKLEKRKSVVSVIFTGDFFYKITCVKFEKRKSVVSATFKRDFLYKLTCVMRRNLVSVHFLKGFPL